MALNQRHNIIRATDAYKPTQDGLDPEGIDYIMEYTTARGGLVPYVQFFGLQYYLMEYLAGQVVTQAKIDFAERQCMKNYGIPYFRKDHWQYILDKHEGRLPLSIRAVPEGMIVPKRNVLMTVVNTDPRCAWLVPYLESLLLKVSRPSTICTRGGEGQKVARRYADMCGEEVPLCIDNDFGYRGLGTEEEAKICGMAHLINSPGGDTFPAFDAAEEYYGGENGGALMLTVRATEHHTMQTWGKDRELEAYREIIRRTPSNAILSLVTDTWDPMYAQKVLLGTELKSEILAREGRTVFRPDSGFPPKIAVESLYQIAECFGYTTNAKGYKVNNPKVGLLMGDQMSFEMQAKVLEAVVAEEKFAISNIVFGMGGKRYAVERDTLGFTTKECAFCKDGVWYDTFKDPKTNAWEKSLGGRLKLCRENGELVTRTYEQPGTDVMEEVFRDGEILKTYTFTDVKANGKLSEIPG
ncbi:MAG: nicotinate phosphoribosyltransferase [Methanoregula sp.]|jgi:nicotinamide phosphoribosyltransferase